MIGLSTSPPAAPRDPRDRSTWAGLAAAAAFLVIAGRLYQLQILRGDEYKGRADENFVKELRVPADRGLILDRNRRILVDERPSYDVALTPYFCGKSCEEALARLSAMLSLSPEEGQRARDRLQAARGLVRFRPFTVKVDITREELDLVEANRVPGGALAGVDVIPTPHRNYRFGSWAAHLFGYMNEVGAEEIDRVNGEVGEGQLAYQPGDNIGRRGLERRWEAELRGMDGRRRVVVDAKGNAKGEKMESELIPEGQRFEPPRSGKSLVLSIDWRLQEFAEAAFPGTAGVVMAMDPRTGFLLALVSRPAPDPNKLSGRITRAELAAIHSDPLQPELFRAIQQHYFPGSTFKVVTAAAALEEGLFRHGGTVFCPGHYSLGKHRWRCDKEAGHGAVDLEHALGASCDVFFYTLGDRLGADRLARWGERLGLGKPTGFDVAGETSGVMPDQAWHDRHIAGGYQRGMAVNLAIGQGDVRVTPMQQLVLYAALASGTVWRPQVVVRIEDERGETLRQFAPEARFALPLRPETRQAVLEGLEAAVNKPFGTAYRSRLADLGVEMAGKTGTAQVVRLGAKRLRAFQVSYFERDHAWFAAFAPVGAPEIAVVVLNEHSGFGASNAAPTAAAVVRKWLQLKAQDEAERGGTAGPQVPDPSPPAPPPSRPGGAQRPRGASTAAPGGARGA
jgi:penicillin-binding protein 2